METPRGQIKALTFAADPRHPRFIGKQPLERGAHMIVQGVGSKGSSQGYLAGTVAAVRGMGGVPEPALLRLQAAVNSLMRRAGIDPIP